MKNKVRQSSWAPALVLWGKMQFPLPLHHLFLPPLSLMLTALWSLTCCSKAWRSAKNSNKTNTNRGEQSERGERWWLRRHHPQQQSRPAQLTPTGGKGCFTPCLAGEKPRTERREIVHCTMGNTRHRHSPKPPPTPGHQPRPWLLPWSLRRAGGWSPSSQNAAAFTESSCCGTTRTPKPRSHPIVQGTGHSDLHAFQFVSWMSAWSRVWNSASQQCLLCDSAQVRVVLEQGEV